MSNHAENFADVIIIGGGPAGLSAALWCDDLGLDSVLLERENSLGGQLRYIYNPIENYLGLRAANGIEMFASFERSVRSRNFVRRIGIQAVSVDVEKMEVHLDGRECLRGKAIILATGVRRRRLNVPGELHFHGKGIVESGARDKLLLSGKRVLIAGGGDAAFENALLVSEFAASVYVAYRRARPSARGEFVEAAAQRNNIKLLPETVVTRISGDSSVGTVELRDSAGRTRNEPVDAVLIRIGVEPNSELVGESLDVDAAGYIKVDDRGETSRRNIYAVGDVANSCSPTLSTAVGTAATAVKAIFESIKKAKEL
ncbi:MAG TPA: NAD(P)/FAD-dependent oxidoreductase [Pyrinomonadaceae bacterium]|nr:NAD(P)/FAD-dependent oxidoreductase [Pyrinomonadaceae bacterium]